MKNYLQVNRALAAEKNFRLVNRAHEAEKNFNLIEKLQGCSKRNRTTFRQSNPDGQPTVNRQSTDGQSQRHYTLGLMKYAAMITLLLTLACGQAWGDTFSSSEIATDPTGGTTKNHVNCSSGVTSTSKKKVKNTSNIYCVAMSVSLDTATLTGTHWIQIQADADYTIDNTINIVGASNNENDGTIAVLMWRGAYSATSADTCFTAVVPENDSGTRDTIALRFPSGRFRTIRLYKRISYNAGTIGRSVGTSGTYKNPSSGASFNVKEITATATAAGGGDCSAYEFHYGTHNEEDWETACFERVGATEEWRIENFTIPSTPNFYLGYHGDGVNGWNSTWSAEKAWTDTWAVDDGKGNGAMVLLPSDGNKVGQATGAVGTLVIWNNSGDKNKYIGFKPDGYVLKFGSTEKAFDVETGNEYRSELIEYNSTNARDAVSVGMADESGDYVACARTEEMQHLFLKDNCGWNADGAKFSIYDLGAKAFKSGFMTAVPGESNLYEGWVDAACTDVIFVRHSSSADSPSWDNDWNQTPDLTLESGKNQYTLTEFSSGSWSAYERKGKFRMNADWSDQNWYVRFYPYYVLTYDVNGGSGAPDAQGVPMNGDSEARTVEVAAGSGMTAPTGYQFAGWNPSKSAADAGTKDGNYDPEDDATLSADVTVYAVWTPKQCTVTFDNNGGTGTITNVTATYNAAMPSKEGNLPTKSGYDFAGFWDGEGGTGTQYYNVDGTSAQNWDKNTTSTTTLYAKWTAHTYTVTLDADYTSGTITPATLSPVYNSDLGTKAVISSASRSNWTYGGFYTGHGGTGTQVIGADKKWVKSVDGWTDGTPHWIHTSNETLYAHWYRTQTIDDNGGSADGNVVANYKGTMGTITAPTYAGCTPDGYYAQAACANLVMAADGTLESDVTNWTSSDRKWIQTGTSKLYAHYKIDAPSISCRRNVVTISTTLAGTTIYYTTNGSDPTTSSTEYTAPFSIAANTTVKAYAVKDKFTDSDVATQACSYETTYAVDYDANLDGASGSTTSQTGNFTDDQVTTNSCGFSKDGYKFKWWNTKDDGTGEDFYVGEKVTIATSDVTLYAQWEEIDTDEAFWVGDVAITDAATAYDVTGNGVTMQITRESSADWNDDINQTWNQVSKHSSTAKKAKVLAIDADDSYIEVKFKDGGTINELNLGVTSDQTTDQNIVVCYSTTADFSTGEYEFVKVGSTDNVVSVPGHNQSTKSVTDVSPSTKDKYRYVRIYRKLKNGSGYNSTGSALGTDNKARIYSIKAKKGVSCATSPTVTAGSNSSVAATTATVTCTLGISSLGSEGCEISSYGFVLGTSSNPTLDNTTYEVGTTYTTKDVSFYKDLTGLTEGTTYYVRPYATNGNGTSYGTQTSFTTHYAITTGSHTNGSVTIPASAASSATVNISATGDTGYGFTSWTIINTSTEADVTTTLLGDNKTTASTSFTMPSYGVTVSATFTAMTYDITYHLNSASWASEEGVAEYTYGTGATLPTASDLSYDGYRFMGWYDNSGLTGSPVEEIGISEYGDKEYWAKWAELYTITTGTHTYGSIAITNSSSAVITQAIEGEMVTITATGGVHYALSEWSIYKTGDESTTVSPAAATASTTFTMPAYGVTVNATFAIESLTLAYADGGATTGSAPTSPAAGSIDYGTEITVPDKGGYAKSTDAFVGWLYNGTTLYTTGQKFTMTENVTLTAVWNTACAGGSETLFSQNFNSATEVAYAENTARAYTVASANNNIVGSTAASQFTSITCTAKGSTGIGVNSSTGGNSENWAGKFGVYYNNTGGYWSMVKTSNFASTAPTVVKITFDALLAVVDNGTSKQAVSFLVGSGFSDGITLPTASNTYTGFSLCTGSSSSKKHAVCKVGSTTLLSSSEVIDYNTMKSFTWVINNSGSSFDYTDPNGETQALANGTWDLWMGTTQLVDGQARASAGSSTFSGSSIQNLYIGSSTGVKHEFHIDNIVITDLTSSGSDCKFDVSFANESGFAGGATVTLPSDIEGVPTGKKLAQPADPTTTGDYVFGGWYDDEDCSDGHEINWNAMTITENVTIYAKWYAADYTITWMVNGETHATTKACDEVTTIVLPTAPADNTLTCADAFRGWSVTNLYGASGQAVPTDLFRTAADAPTINADKTFYAIFGDDASEPATSFTTTFNSKSWGDENSKWTSGQDGSALLSGRGVQVQTGASGANATTNEEYKAVTSVVVTYSTNASNGAGSIDIKVGGTAMIGNADVTKTGGTTDRTITYTPVSALNGKVKITVNTTENSIYVKSIQIYHSGSFENYRCICPSLTVTPELITASTPIFITSTASKTVRSQDSLVIVGSGLQKSATLTLTSPASKFTLKSRTNTNLTTDATGAISAVGYIFYTPDAGDTSDGLDQNSTFTISDGTNAVEVEQALIGRHLPAEFVIAAKRNNKWYALPSNMASTTNPKPAEIAVNNLSNPSIAYTAISNIYSMEGPTASNISGGKGDYIRFVMMPLWVDNEDHSKGHAPLFGRATGNNTIGKSDDAQATSDLNSGGWWWQLKQTNTSITNPQDAKYTIYNHNNTSSLSLRENAGNPDWGLFASGVEELRLIPASDITFTEAYFVEWAQHGGVIEVDAQGVTATSVVAHLGEATSSAITLVQTGTSVKGTGTKYNYTVNFGDGIDFADAASNGAMLTLEWKNGETVKAMSNIVVPKIVASKKLIANSTNYPTKSVWDTEVHVLPGDTLEIDASGYDKKVITINELNIYPGATVRIVGTNDTLSVRSLVLRNGWTRAGEKTYDVARLYVSNTSYLKKANNKDGWYSDWYIDYDQYYPIAVPFPVATSGICYKNTKQTATAGVKLRYYSGERRATNIQENQALNWVEYTWGGTMPANLDPSKGYIMTAKRPSGKAFSIVRLPMTFSNEWTALGEKGSIEVDEVTTHKDQVTVTAWGDANTPSYAKGWNIIANPYMSLHQGELSYNDASGDVIQYANIPDISFKEYDQLPIETTKLKPASAFLVQAPKDGTVTFGAANRKPSAPGYRREVQETLPKQKAYIVLNNEQSEDMMGILVSDKYSAEYEINADLEKLLGDGTSLKTYMHYGERSMAYVAINKMLAQEWIPVSVRLPQAGEYTFSLHEASKVGELEGVYLIDYTSNEVTNLIENSYTFVGEAGTISNRFAINATVGERQTPTAIDVVGVDKGDGPIKFLYRDKVYIWHNGVIYDATGKRVKGGQK